MKRKESLQILKPVLQRSPEKGSYSIGVHDSTATTHSSSTYRSQTKNSSLRKNKSRSIIDCESITTFNHSQLEVSEFKYDPEIAPIKEKNQEISKDEDSILLELADFLGTNPKKSEVPNEPAKILNNKKPRKSQSQHTSIGKQEKLNEIKPVQRSKISSVNRVIIKTKIEGNAILKRKFLNNINK
ncbi:unnamed protein product [Blepharisma stoltei]|uniref:Uncharacterized protein n=1 Tax=Blepharisma stoltei TaxID=1481888 RepID=A0AAU9K4L5_9CILI|nr:unnamed protein product [Blepharisma stoltei]